MGFERPRNLDPRDSEEVDSPRGSPPWDEDEKQGRLALAAGRTRWRFWEWRDPVDWKGPPDTDASVTVPTDPNVSFTSRETRGTFAAH
jgi:hypothetical protein